MFRPTAFPLILALATPVFAQNTLDPAAPIGIEAGRFIIFPAVETSLILSAAATTDPGWSVVVSPELLLQSDGARYSAELFLGADMAAGPPISTIVDLRLVFDLDGLWSLRTGAGHRLEPEDVRDPALPAGIDEAPNVTRTSADIALGGPVGRSEVRAEIGAVRRVHGDVLVEGIATDQTERDHTVIQGTLVIQTAEGVLVRPFVEAIGGRRVFDQAVDGDGFLQAGSFASVRAGLSYDSAPVLTAEIGVGYRREVPDDPGLATIAGLVFDAIVGWSPHEMVSFTLVADTVFDPDASPVMGSSVARSLTAGSELSLRGNLVLVAGGSIGIERFADSTVELAAATRATLVWAPNRWLRIGAGYSQEWLWSPDPARTGSAGTLSLTARVQR